MRTTTIFFQFYTTQCEQKKVTCCYFYKVNIRYELIAACNSLRESKKKTGRGRRSCFFLRRNIQYCNCMCVLVRINFITNILKADCKGINTYMDLFAMCFFFFRNSRFLLEYATKRRLSPCVTFHQSRGRVE